MITSTESDVLVKVSCCVSVVCLHVCKMNGALIMLHDIMLSHQLDTVAAIYGFGDTSLTYHFLPLS